MPHPLNSFRMTDLFEFYKTLPKDKTYSFQTGKARDTTTGRFVKLTKEQKKSVDRIKLP